MDRAAHRRTDHAWLDEAFGRARIILVDSAGRTLCAVPGPGAGVGLWYVGAGDAPDGERLFLGEDSDDVPYFAVITDLPEVTGARPVSLREVGALLSARDAGLFVTAAALARWHAHHRFSPITGQPTTMALAGWSRVDPSGAHLFPRTDPAMIVLVHDGRSGPAGRCLLGANAAWRPRAGGARYLSTLAGFVEAGESAEAAVEREVHEEVGLRVWALRYEGSQAWPFPGSLMLGFTAQADPTQPLFPDASEIADARWFTRAEIGRLLTDQPDPTGAPHAVASPGAPIMLPGPASIAHFLIRAWLHR